MPQVSKPKLLLADDSPTIQKVINLTFADRGMDVMTYSDGDAAFADLERVRPDIVLADVHMPGMSGYQICELMRGNEVNRDIPVLLLVGSFEPFDRDEALRVGATGHLTKPFTSISELVSTVESLITSSVVSPEGQQLPDTSDIDHLYQQSFVETVEIPRGTDAPGNFSSDTFDDDMIETSYADDDVVSEIDDGYFSQNDDDEQYEEIGAESLIAESMAPDSAGFEDQGPRGEIDVANDPFETVVEDSPETHESPPDARFPAPETDGDDLLDLPVSEVALQSGSASGDSPSAAGKTIDSLSPELIELIVDKVVERLSQKYQDQSLKMGG